MDHIDDADLERYCLDLVTEEPKLAAIEEHLLWCQSCLDRAEAIDRLLGAVRTGRPRRKT